MKQNSPLSAAEITVLAVMRKQDTIFCGCSLTTGNQNVPHHTVSGHQQTISKLTKANVVTVHPTTKGGAMPSQAAHR